MAAGLCRLTTWLRKSGSPRRWRRCCGYSSKMPHSLAMALSSCGSLGYLAVLYIRLSPVWRVWAGCRATAKMLIRLRKAVLPVGFIGSARRVHARPAASSLRLASSYVPPPRSYLECIPDGSPHELGLGHRRIPIMCIGYSCVGGSSQRGSPRAPGTGASRSYPSRH